MANPRTLQVRGFTEDELYEQLTVWENSLSQDFRALHSLRQLQRAKGQKVHEDTLFSQEEDADSGLQQQRQQTESTLRGEASGAAFGDFMPLLTLVDFSKDLFSPIC